MSKLITREQMQEFAAEMKNLDWTNPEDRRAVALTVLRYVELEVQKNDLESLLVDTTTFAIGESPQWITHKGLKAYVHEPGSYAPRSVITQKALTITTEQVSVHPEFELNQLRAGRYGTVTDIRDMAVQELLGRKYSIIWTTILGSIASTDSNYGTFASGASVSTKKTALDTAIDYVEDESPGGARAIVARRTALTWINDVDGFSERNKETIENNGILGFYRGVPIIRLSQYSDGYGNKLITDDKIVVVGTGSTKLGRNQDLEVLDDININDKMWHLRMDEQYGVVVHYPRRNYLIEIT